MKDGKYAKEQHKCTDYFAQKVLPKAADGRRCAENGKFETRIFSGGPVGQVGKPDNGSAGETASDLRQHGYESLARAVNAKHGLGQGYSRVKVSLGRAKRHRCKHPEHDAKSPARRDNNPADAVALGVFKQNAGNNASTKGNQYHRSKKFTKKVGHGQILHKLLIWQQVFRLAISCSNSLLVKMGGLLGAIFLSAWMPKALWYLGVVLQNVRV